MKKIGLFYATKAERTSWVAEKIPFQEVRYNAQFYPERFKWSVETISEKS